MKKIIVIPGDGIGKEVTDSAVVVLKKLTKNLKSVLSLNIATRAARLTINLANRSPQRLSTLAKKPMRFCSARSAGKNGTISPWTNVPKKLFLV